VPLARVAPRIAAGARLVVVFAQSLVARVAGGFTAAG
jgi:hypothetical protein